MKLDDIKNMNIPYLARIELGVNTGQPMPEEVRGNKIETVMGYYMELDEKEEFPVIYYVTSLCYTENKEENKFPDITTKQGYTTAFLDYIKILKPKKDE